MSNKIELTKQEDVGNTTPVTYKSYISMYGQPYKHFIMLAELIDNSISSFENHYENEEWDKKLEIEMIFDFRGEIKDTKENSLGFKYMDGSKMIISDNGFGMDEKLLKEALILDNNNAQISDKNVWGRGMKQCAYFFGQDLSIRTSNGEKTFEVNQIYTDDNINLYSPYRIQPREVERVASGTKITIENIYDRRKFSKDTLKGIVDSLEWRYVNYIKNGKLVVNYAYYDDDGKVVSGSFEQKNEEKLLIDEAVKKKVNSHGIDLIKEELKTSFDSLEKNETKYNLDINIAYDVFDKLEQLFLTSIAGESMPAFESTTRFKLKHSNTGETVSVPFKFWALPKGSPEKNAGIRLYENERAITHISIKDKNVGPWMGWVENADKSWRTDKKFAGELDLSLLGVKPSVDKSMFALSEEMLNKLQKNIWTVYKVYEIFMRLIMKKEVLNSNVDKVEIDIDDVVKTTKEHSPSNQVIVDVEKSQPKENIFVFKYPIEDKEWFVEVEFNYMEKPPHIMYPIMSGDDQTNFKVVVYRLHKFWNIIRSSAKDNEKEFILNAVMPIIHLIVGSSIKMTDPTLHVEKMNEAAKEQTQQIIRGDDFVE